MHCAKDRKGSASQRNERRKMKIKERREDKGRERKEKRKKEEKNKLKSHDNPSSERLAVVFFLPFLFWVCGSIRSRGCMLHVVDTAASGDDRSALRSSVC